MSEEREQYKVDASKIDVAKEPIDFTKITAPDKCHVLQAMTDTELNELAAVKVMGWTELDRQNDGYIFRGDMENAVVFNPTVDMNDAMELAEQLRGVAIPVIRMVNDQSDDKWMCELWGLHSTDYQGNGIKVYEKNAPRAITIAAILAKIEA